MRAEIRWGARSVLRALSVLALGLLASCYEFETSENVGGDSHFLRPCQQQSQCDDLGERYTCEDGYCRAPVQVAVDDAGAEAQDARAAVATGMGDGSGTTSGSTAEAAEETRPLVLLLVDTSGSSERTSDCVCDDLACMNCLPRCDPAAGESEKNRWTQTLEALTGTFRDFSCEALERSLENGATYDIGYYLPYHRPAGSQEGDGVLDLYRDRLRFGLATFDGMETYVGGDRLIPDDTFDLALSTSMSGQWSYSPALEIGPLLEVGGWPIGSFKYPNCTGAYFMDTGIRSARASEGALRVAVDSSQVGEVNDAIQLDLSRVRPYGGTPIASSLDDLYYVLKQDSMLALERARSLPRHVVLITDGEPDRDYREDLHCDCAEDGDDPERCGLSESNDPSTMHCP